MKNNEQMKFDQNEQQLSKGYKIVPYSPEFDAKQLFKKYSEIENDWSAIYIQKSIKHAMTYIYTKYEKFKEVCLMEFTFHENIKFITVDHDAITQHNITSEEKGRIVKQILKDNYEIIILNNQPLLDTLGLFNIGLIMQDSDNLYEYIIPHKLIQEQANYNYQIIATFQRHETIIFRTLSVFFNNKQIILNSDQRDQIHNCCELWEII